MKRTILTIVFGTLILFVWNAISWMALPFHEQSMQSIPDKALNTKKLQRHMTEDGVYHWPGLPENDSEEAFKEIEEKLAAGPRITLMVYKSGSTSFFDPMNFFWNLLYILFTVILLLGIVRRLANRTTRNILWVTIAVGLVIGLMSDLQLMNWFMFPLDYTAANILDYLVMMTLLGLLFAKYTFKSPPAE